MQIKDQPDPNPASNIARVQIKGSQEQIVKAQALHFHLKAQSSGSALGLGEKTTQKTTKISADEKNLPLSSQKIGGYLLSEAEEKLAIHWRGESLSPRFFHFPSQTRLADIMQLEIMIRIDKGTISILALDGAVNNISLWGQNGEKAFTSKIVEAWISTWSLNTKPALSLSQIDDLRRDLMSAWQQLDSNHNPARNLIVNLLSHYQQPWAQIAADKTTNILALLFFLPHFRFQDVNKGNLKEKINQWKQLLAKRRAIPQALPADKTVQAPMAAWLNLQDLCQKHKLDKLKQIAEHYQTISYDQHNDSHTWQIPLIINDHHQIENDHDNKKGYANCWLLLERDFIEIYWQTFYTGNLSVLLRKSPLHLAIWFHDQDDYQIFSQQTELWLGGHPFWQHRFHLVDGQPLTEKWQQLLRSFPVFSVQT